MAEMKIKGLKMFYSTSELTIIDSYQIHNIKKMETILTEALEKAENYITNRNMNSLINEWIAHNVFYKLHLFRKYTKDCNFKKTQNKISLIKNYLIKIQ